MTRLGPQSAICRENTELIRLSLCLPVGHTGYGCHGGNPTAGPLQLHDRFDQESPFLPWGRNR
jgi:hypothetical protein